MITTTLTARSLQSSGNTVRRNMLYFNLLLLMFIGLYCITANTSAQTVSQPTSAITSTAAHFSYAYKLSPTTKKELEYIIVKASNGDIKTVFNACDVCYSYHKGYSQNGTDLRCNNCGNRFPIDGLGNQSTGSCNPGYLPHSIQGSDVVINVSDLVAGAYFFVTQTISGVNDIDKKPEFILASNDRQRLTVTLSGERERIFHIFNMKGQHCRTISNSSNVVQIDIADLAAGAYILAVQENKAFSTKSFVKY